MTDKTEQNDPNEPHRRLASATARDLHPDPADRRQPEGRLASDVLARMAQRLAAGEEDDEQALILNGLQRRQNRIAERAELASSNGDADQGEVAPQAGAATSIGVSGDVAGNSREAGAWDRDAAEVLTRHYESEGFGAKVADRDDLAMRAPGTDAAREPSAPLHSIAPGGHLEQDDDTDHNAGNAGAPREAAPEVAYATPQDEEHQPAPRDATRLGEDHGLAAVPAATAAPSLPAEEWFAERFEMLGERIEILSGGAISDANLAVLLERLDGLEARLDATVAQVGSAGEQGGSLHQIELCIAELAAQLETTNTEIARISEIEAHITEFTRGVLGESDAAPRFDPAAIAALVTERLASRPMPLAAAEPAYGELEQAGIGELTTMMKEYVNERRTDGEHANAVLDTMQQTIIRLLDRMDALESGHRIQPSPEASWAEPAKEAAPEAPSAAPAPDRDQRESADEALAATFGRRQPGANAGLDAAHETSDAASSRRRLEQAIGELENAAAEATDPACTAARRPGRRTEAQEWAEQHTQKQAQELAQSLARTRAQDGMADVDPRPRRKPRKPVDPVADRNRFAEAARAAAANANQRLRAADDTDEMVLAGSAPTGRLGVPVATGAAKSRLPSSRVRLLVAALAIIVVGLGATKLVTSFTSGGTKPAAVQENSKAPKPDKSAAMTAPDSVPAAHVRAAAPAVIQEGESATAADLAQPAAINPAESLAAPASGQQALGTSRMALPDMMVGPLSLRLAAANGDASAQFEVAARYAEGRGVRQDFKEAVRWYQHSAAASFALSQYRLGTLYERGLGVDKDLARARVWYGRAAAQGNVKAMHNLAVLAAGNSAGQPDYITAAQWFTAAAEHGLADSQFNLAILYQHGLGVAQDETRAYRWFSLAALSGDGEAKKRKAEAAKSLKLDQVAELDRAIAEWQRRPVSKLANDPHVAGQHWQRSAS